VDQAVVVQVVKAEIAQVVKVEAVRPERDNRLSIQSRETRL
jgi:hypothetical protein